MTVYAVMLFERHIGWDMELFAERPSAVARARTLAEEYARSPEDIEEEHPGFFGHEYYAGWGSEGDRVVVVVRTVEGQS